MKKSHKKIVTVLLILFFLTVSVLFLEHPNDSIKYGLTFSPPQAGFFGLDWKQVYLETLNDLKVKRLRIPTYWNMVEGTEGKFNFSEIDFMLDEARSHQAQVILVVGKKQPRWPECHQPEWVNKLSDSGQQTKLLNYIKVLILRYQDREEIVAWQVENEPLFPFGPNCPVIDKLNLQEEISLVKNLDPYRPVILTDTGEWSGWGAEMKMSDILGISLYRTAYNPYLGYYKYPFTPSFYIIKSYLTRLLFAPHNQKTLVLELQTEPWFEDNPLKLTPLVHSQFFSLNDFQSNIQFNKSVGFDESYLWGVEWWYWMKQNNYPEYWDYAKTLFPKSRR